MRFRQPARLTVCVLATALPLVVGCTPAVKPHSALRVAQPTEAPTAATSAPETGPSIAGVQVVNASSAYAVGAGQIWRTDNSGASWRQQWHGPLELDEIDALSSRSAFAVGSGQLLATTDGTNWTLMPPAAIGPLDDIHFVTPSIGFARGVLSVGRTDDGGRHWVPIKTPKDPLAVTACDAHRLWLGTVNTLWYSGDGGASWRRRLVVPDALLIGNSEPNEDVVLQPARGCHVWVRFAASEGAASQRPWSIYVGGPETRFQEPASEMGSDYPPAFSAIDARTVAIAGDDPAADPGTDLPVGVFRDSRTLRVGRAPAFEPLALSFGAGQVGYLVGVSEDGSSHVLAVTHDGGRSWRRSLVKSG